MKTRVLHIWELLSSSYWFVPSIMAAVSIILAFTMLWVDEFILDRRRERSWFYAGGAEGARSLLSTVASSTITVAGVVFSITIAALTQASSQFGPRLLRNFMRDTGNQLVLGTFVATFIYSMLILRTIYGANDSARVPHASVTVGVFLAITSVAVLIYFIHHVSSSLQAPQVVAKIPEELNSSLPHQFPRGLGEEREGSPQQQLGNGQPIFSDIDGYIQAIDQETLLAIATGHDLVIKLIRRPGHHISKNMLLMEVYPQERCVSELTKKINHLFIVGEHRTSEQDVEYAINQLVEIAIRALSAGINDPFTAISCVDWLGVSLGRIVRSGLPKAERYDHNGQLRVIAPVISFEGLVDAAFNQIRQIGREHLSVMIRLLEVIGALVSQFDDPGQIRTLRMHAKMVREDALQCVTQERDRTDLEERYATIFQIERRK